MPAPVTGLSAFPLTPLSDDRLDEEAFARIVRRLAASGVDSIAALGSTGAYAYLDRAERAAAMRIAVEQADGTPVIAGIGATRTSQVVAHAEEAQAAGAAAALLAPVSYQPLSDDEVIDLFRTVAASTDLPIIVYDNPRTTGFTFSTGLYGRVAEIPNVASIKIPGVPADLEKARTHVAEIRAVLPEHVTIGVSGDAFAATGLLAGCDAWYSVVAGTLTDPALALFRAARSGDVERTRAADGRLRPLWDLFARHGGGMRVVAAIAEELGWAHRPCLPAPLRGLDDEARSILHGVLDRLEPI